MNCERFMCLLLQKVLGSIFYIVSLYLFTSAVLWCRQQWNWCFCWPFWNRPHGWRVSHSVCVSLASSSGPNSLCSREHCGVECIGRLSCKPVPPQRQNQAHSSSEGADHCSHCNWQVARARDIYHCCLLNVACFCWSVISLCLCVVCCHSCFVTGDARGHIRFYDEEFMLLTWYNEFNLDAIVSISFSKESTKGYIEDCTLETKPLVIRYKRYIFYLLSLNCSLKPPDYSFNQAVFSFFLKELCCGHSQFNNTACEYTEWHSSNPAAWGLWPYTCSGLPP